MRARRRRSPRAPRERGCRAPGTRSSETPAPQRAPLLRFPSRSQTRSARCRQPERSHAPPGAGASLNQPIRRLFPAPAGPAGGARSLIGGLIRDRCLGRGPWRTGRCQRALHDPRERLIPATRYAARSSCLLRLITGRWPARTPRRPPRGYPEVSFGCGRSFWLWSNARFAPKRDRKRLLHPDRHHATAECHRPR